ncbi:MAG: hypothetical protein JW847_09660 [Candidatus Omnitrophica bacterium]|nr:hypothetical protein [Candidatus Omnitrophota bacterium]
MRHVVGVDFDNTIVNYDKVMYQTAVRFGWVDDSVRKNKKDVRDRIRLLPQGEIKWRKLQATVYGQAMRGAIMNIGVKEFFRSCRMKRIPTYIISHKTKYAAEDEQKIDLRKVALDWMEEQGFFGQKEMGLARDQVYFESTRQKKIERIRKMGCTCFVDDLQETFLEPSFPGGVEKILFSKNAASCLPKEIKIIGSWKEISDYLFNTNNA